MKTRTRNHRNNKTNKAKKEKRVSGKSGLPPGSLVHIGRTLTDKVTVVLTEYNKESIKTQSVSSVEKISIQPGPSRKWIEVTGLHDTPLIENIGKYLGINMLMMEDIVNTEHRPKFEMQDGFLFLTFKAFSLDEQKQVVIEQISFVLGADFLVTFQESHNPWFSAVKERLSNPSGMVRQSGLDYLLYCLVDVVVDQYYAIAETIGDQLEELEEQIFDNPSQELITTNRLVRKEILAIRKVLYPSLEAINKLNRFRPDLIGQDIQRYFDDIDDHLVQILDYIDTYRELSAELKENYLSNLSFKMNQVMKLLTIITTIFIPLSFVAGVYGMNFHYMPELTWKYGYFAVWGLMVAMIITMLIYFRKKKWM